MWKTTIWGWAVLAAHWLLVAVIATVPGISSAAPVTTSRFMKFEEQVPHPHGTNDSDFHRKQFLAERIGWAAMAVFLTWALLGGFGDGWISGRQASNPAGSCAIDYQRFGRRDAPIELDVRLKLESPQERISLGMHRNFLDRVKIERVTPADQSMETDADGVRLVFNVKPSVGEHSFTIEYKPQHIGPVHAAVRPQQEPEVAFDQFIYP